jgi:hypothetical protein
MGTPDVAWGVRLRDEVEKGKLRGPHLVVAGRKLNDDLNATKARQAARAYKAAGADFVKVYSELDKEAYLAIADECKRVGLPLNLAIELHPKEARFHAGLCDVYSRKGMKEKAAEACKRALEIDPSFTSAQELLKKLLP